MEREHLEDLFAEARAKYEADRARMPRNDQGGRRHAAPAAVQAAVQAAEQGRAA
jgi:hypothetical protein